MIRLDSDDKSLQAELKAGGSIPRHIAIIMDGNGRWANSKGLTRIEGHKAGEAALLDVVAGAVEVGVTHLSAYAFSTENWRRSPDEVRFLMGFNRDVLHRRRDQLNEWGVRVRWAGRRPRLWSSVIKELGDHPQEGGKWQVLSGRYGPYVKHGKINATIPGDRDPEQVPLEEAPHMYEVFQKKQDECIKVVLSP